jgi:hypothetical protein
MSDILKLKISIDGEYKGTIKSGDQLPSEWFGDCGEHLFQFEVDGLDKKDIGYRDAIRILKNEKL